ncbi:hypothetical protein HT746_35420, partial [Burkholderia pyrrocinia]|nr:hypothetical protein [Burkholderia pyrrocinia]
MKQDPAPSRHRPDPPMPDVEPDPGTPELDRDVPPGTPEPYCHPEGDPPGAEPPEREP